MNNPWVAEKLFASLETAEKAGGLTPAVLSTVLMRGDLPASERLQRLRKAVYTKYLSYLTPLHKGGVEAHFLDEDLTLNYAKALLNGSTLEEAESITAFQAYSQDMDYNTAAKSARRLSRAYQDQAEEFQEHEGFTLMFFVSRSLVAPTLQKKTNETVMSTAHLAMAQFMAGTAPYFGFESPSSPGVFVVPHFVAAQLRAAVSKNSNSNLVFSTIRCTEEHLRTPEVCETILTLIRDDTSTLNGAKLKEYFKTATALAG